MFYHILITFKEGNGATLYNEIPPGYIKNIKIFQLETEFSGEFQNTS